MVIVAQNLMMHGIIGKAKVRKLQRHETNETTAEFRAADYIMAARNHFGISREEAENLTMTEFSLMLNAKYPNQKGFTREEYDTVMDEDDRRWQAMMEQEQASNQQISQPRNSPGLLYPNSPRISRAFHTEPFRMTLEDTGWLSVPFCGPDSCETRFITKR
jgi:hypothetical protein